MLIRTKLLLRFSLLVLLIQLLVAAFVYWFYASSREQRFADRLRAEAELSARLLVRQRNLNPAFLRTYYPRDVPNMAGEQLTVFDPTERLVYTSADRQSLNLHRRMLAQVHPGQPVHFADAEGETVGLDYNHEGQYYTVFAGGVDNEGFRQLARLRLILLLGTAGALALSVLAGWHFAGEALHPMAAVVAQVRRITAEHLGLRVDEGNGTDEIAQLARTFNQMLNGLEHTFAAQKSFVAHASHELRTPLATLLGTLETAAAYDRALPDAQASIAVAVTELRKLIDLSNSLLALAQADESTFQGETVRLDECVVQALNHCHAKYPALPVQLTFGLLPEEVDNVFAVRGNAQLLTTAVLNLLDNALKFSARPVVAELGYIDSATLRLTVSDTGPGLTPQELERAFEPLYRGAAGRYQPGHGIGLAVVQKVVALHGGTLALTATPGHGATATLVLPAAPAGLPVAG